MIKLFEKKEVIEPMTEADRDAWVERLSRNGVEYELKEVIDNYMTGARHFQIRLRPEDLQKLA